jgi:hypothetical protein
MLGTEEVLEALAHGPAFCARVKTAANEDHSWEVIFPLHLYGCGHNQVPDGVQACHPMVLCTLDHIANTGAQKFSSMANRRVLRSKKTVLWGAWP